MNVQLPVAMLQMSSMSCISGTGFMKCMPMNCLGQSVDAASCVINVCDVFEPTIMSGFE